MRGEAMSTETLVAGIITGVMITLSIVIPLTSAFSLWIEIVTIVFSIMGILSLYLLTHPYQKAERSEDATKGSMK